MPLWRLPLCDQRRAYQRAGMPLSHVPEGDGRSFYARVMVPLDSVDLNGPIGWFNSSPGMRRGFCLRCGTTLFSERVSANTMGLTMGSLDEPDAFAPTEHIWTSSMQAWLRLDDGLVQYPTTPPA